MATQAALPPTLTPKSVTAQSTEPIQSPEAYPSPTVYVYYTATLPNYPVPRSGTDMYTPVPIIIPEPTDTTGVVVGKMLDKNTGDPMKFVYVYLGKKNFLTPGPGYTYGLQEKSSPHTQTDENGLFAIGNIPPGTYILMIWTPHSASVVMEPNTDRERDIVVEAGKTLEMGDVEALPPTY